MSLDVYLISKTPITKKGTGVFIRENGSTKELTIEDMKNRPEHFKKFDSKNGWGTYDQFLPWIENYLNACRDYPDTYIEVSR